MKLPELKIGNITAKLPIIQGGMGVGISLNNLASAVANEGGIGVISGVQIGFREPDFTKDPLKANIRALKKEIKLAREKSPQGIIGVNFMVAMNNYDILVKEAVKEKIDLIICGAGLPINLPALVEGSATKIAPIVSSAKAASVICRMWDKRHKTAPDFIVVEGPLAGGHLGFTSESLEDGTAQSLEEILLEVKDIVRPYAKKYNKDIPLIAAGGIHDGKDIKKIMDLGADGVQMGTRFITTHECDADHKYKIKHITSEKKDIITMMSPVGMPGRAIANNLLANPPGNNTCMYKCLQGCKVNEIPYCISSALFRAADGDTDNSLLFCGAKGYKSKEIISVKKLINELKTTYSNQ